MPQENYEINKKNESGEGPENHIPANSVSLGRNHKIAIVLLIVFGILAIGMWFFQFKKSLSQPFAYKGSNETINTQAPEENSEEALKNKDNDSDGLNDWDELNNYKTSPYLEDSDSDGFSDKEEIDNGKDPNCPVGRECGAPTDTNTENSNNTGNISDNLTNDLTSQLNNIAGGSADEAELQNFMSGKSDASALRKMLLASGVNKAMLEKISDEDLLKNYQEMLKE